MKKLNLFVMALGNVLPVCNWQVRRAKHSDQETLRVAGWSWPSAGCKPAARWALAVTLMLAVNAFAADALTERLQRGLFEEEANRNLDAAIKEYQSVVTQADEQRKVVATALFRLGECYRKLGRTNDASAQYQRILRDFSEQEPLVKLSRELLGVKAVAALPGTVETASLTQAEAEELARVKTLARNSPDLLNASSEQSELQKAAGGGRYSVVEFLLSQGLSPSDPVRGISPLVAAANGGHLRIVQLLLDKGATTNDVSQALVSASAAGFKSVAEALLARGADVNRQNYNAETALHHAVYNGHRPIVEMLLQHGANPNVLLLNPRSGNWNSFNYNQGATPLHLAAYRGDSVVARLLIKAGASVKVTNQEGLTPLHIAAGRSYTNVCVLLIEAGADLNATMNDGSTPLASAISNSQAETAALLVSRGADVNRVAVRADKYTPYLLHLAVGRGSPPLLRALLVAKPDLEVTDFDGNTPVQYAVANNLWPQAELLLEAGANPNRPMPKVGTLLHQAVAQGQASLVAALLNAKADPNVLNQQGETPLSLALRRPAPQSPGGISFAPIPGSQPARPVVDYDKIISLLKAHGADEFLQRRGFISAVRGPRDRVNIFSKGTNDLNRYTLMEFLAAVYENSGYDFPFPDFGKVVVYRLEGKTEKPLLVNVAALMAVTNCAGDLPLEWGDNVEIPMADHPVNAQWTGVAAATYGDADPRSATLTSCLQRTVRFSAGGTNLSTQLGVWILDTRTGHGAKARQPLFRLSAVVRRDNRFRSLLRSSSDLSRVTVTRTDPQTKETTKMTFDLNAVALPDMSYSSGNQPPIPWAHDLWLRDGDVIEVPEKP